jgi:hypothetical protein
VKDFIGTDRYGFERILMQLLIPGLVALGPFVWWLYRLHEQAGGRLMHFISANKELALFVVAVFAIIIGAILEELALRIENQYIDRVNSRWDPNVRAVWYAYLRTVGNDKEGLVVLPGYNSSVVARFKFTLSLSLALVFTTVGVLCLIWDDMLSLAGRVPWVLPVALFLGAAYLFFESKDTATLLHDNRVLLLQALKQIPMDYDYPMKKDCPDNGERYGLVFHGADCCSAYREFRILDASKEYWLVEALERKPPAARRGWFSRSKCRHIGTGEFFYYHRSVLEKLPPTTAA